MNTVKPVYKDKSVYKDKPVYKEKPVYKGHSTEPEMWPLGAAAFNIQLKIKCTIP